MSVNTRLAERTIDMLERHGFDVVLQSSTPAAGGDFSSDAPTWADTATLRAVWDKVSGSGSERLGDERARSQGRMALMIAYTDLLKDNSTVANKRISYNGSHFNIASVAMTGDRVALTLSLEDGVAT